MKSFAFAFIAIAFFGACIAAPAAPQCQAPNGGGITPVLKEIVELIPKEKIVSIFLTAVSNDAEVQAAMTYITSDEFQGLLKTIAGTPEYKKVVDYACGKLYFDVYYYINVIRDYLGLPPVNRPVLATLNDAARARSGLHGMLLDMLDVIPLDKIKALWEEKQQSDEYVKLALELLKSEDFKKIVSTVRNLNEYQKILTDLRGMGVQVDKVLEALSKMFGW